jgi:hypothetical protein
MRDFSAAILTKTAFDTVPVRSMLIHLGEEHRNLAPYVGLGIAVQSISSEALPRRG